jgi:hypothetical protein
MLNWLSHFLPYIFKSLLGYSIKTSNRIKKHPGFQIYITNAAPFQLQNFQST